MDKSIKVENRLSILFVIPAFTIGGTIISTLNMIMLLDKQKYRIAIQSLSHQGTEAAKFKNFQVLRENPLLSLIFSGLSKEKSFIKRTGIGIERVLSKLLSYIGLNLDDTICRLVSHSKVYTEYDVVVACQEGFATNFVSHISNVKKIAWLRSEYSASKRSQSKLIAELERYSKFDNIVCVSEVTMNDFNSIFPSLINRTTAIHNIQDTEYIREKSNDAIGELSENIFNIVSIGRFTRIKRYASIPEIAARLKSFNLSFKWYIIGDGNMDGEKDRIQSNINKYSMEDTVIMLGQKSNPYPYMKRANLVVVPSITEACPRSVAESFIVGTPVVCADFNSANEFVKDGINGFIRPIDRLWEPIKELMLDEELYSSICNNICLSGDENDAIYKQLDQIFTL